MEEITGKTVLVTGAARGMGKLEASKFAREGCRVIITDVHADGLASAETEMKAQGWPVAAYVLDISDRQSCVALVKRIEEEQGPIDILVNNAGITECYAVLDLSEASLRRMMDVNYFGTTWMMQAVVPRMVERGGGHVVNICSIAGKTGSPLMGGYCATKHAIVGITDSIRMELRGTGVEFSIINPGFVSTGMFEGAKLPLITRWQDPQKVADAVVRAVRKNQAEVCVPRFAVRLVLFMRGLGLPRLVDWSFRVLGQMDSMERWKKDPSRPF
jgi:short-subunit dehydrogenase